MMPKINDSKLDIEIREVEIDNPGGGDCAFYAFAIGLIQIIKHEASYNRSVVFDRWVSIDPSIKDLKNQILECTPEQLKKLYIPIKTKTLLNTLQSSLRTITYALLVDSLHQGFIDSCNNYEKLTSLELFINLDWIYNGNHKEDLYNIFAKSPAVTKAFQELKKKNVPQDQETSEKIELLKTLLYGTSESITSETPFLKDSIILSALQLIQKSKVFWGLHTHLALLANTFQVNLSYQYNGVDKETGGNWPHTLKVNNKGNLHWTTKVWCALDKNVKKEPLLLRKPKVEQSKGSKEQVQVKGYKEQVQVKGYKEQVQVNEKQSLIELKKKVLEVTASYLEYSESLSFSLFHRHGEAGKVRAIQFDEMFSEIKDLREAKKALIEFLEDDANGNTNPHSYRTMLLNKLIGKEELVLSTTSKYFDYRLGNLAGQWGIKLPDSESSNNNTL